MTEMDLLVCGGCQQDFPLSEIVHFMRHKKFDCDTNGVSRKVLLCQSCPKKFVNPWSLLKHAQITHAFRLFMEQAYYGTSVGARSMLPSTLETGQVITLLDHPGKHLTSSNSNSKELLSDGDCQSLNVATSMICDGNSNIVRETLGGIVKNKPQSGTVVESDEIAEESSFQQATIPSIVISDYDALPKSSKNQPIEGPPIKHDSSTVQDSQMLAFLSADAQHSNPSLVKNSLGQTSQAPPKSSPTSASCSSIKSTCDASVQACEDKIVQGEEVVSTDKDQQCCSDEKCGVLLMPGTHEELKKCCSAVVPKKRKRHMETKHMSKVKSSKKKSKQDQGSTIYIDFEPSDVSSFSVTSGNHSPNEQRRLDSTSRITSELGQSHSAKPASLGLSGGSANQGFVIIPPGKTFSIPLSCSLASTSDIPHLISTPRQLPFHLSATQLSPEIMTGVSKQEHSVETPAHIDAESFDPEEKESTAANYNATSDTSADNERELHINEDSMEGQLDFDRSAGFKKRRYPTSKPFKCDQCDNAFNQRIHLKKHQSKHTGVKPYKCQQCDYATVERSHLKVHIRVHTGEKPFKCTYCEYATAQNSTLKIHLKRHHKGTKGGSSRAFNCSQCGKGFTKKEMLSMHSKEHVASCGGDEEEAGSEVKEMQPDGT